MPTACSSQLGAPPNWLLAPPLAACCCQGLPQRVAVGVPVPYVHRHGLRQRVVRRQAHAAQQAQHGDTEGEPNQGGSSPNPSRHPSTPGAPCCRHAARQDAVAGSTRAAGLLRWPAHTPCRSPPGAQRDYTFAPLHPPVRRRVELAVPGELVVNAYHHRICAGAGGWERAVHGAIRGSQERWGEGSDERGRGRGGGRGEGTGMWTKRITWPPTSAAGAGGRTHQGTGSAGRQTPRPPPRAARR